MKKTFIVTAFVFLTAIGANVYAQQTPPPGAGDKDLRDTDIKRRSVEMERIDREARKNDKTVTSPGVVNPAATKEDKLAAKYDEIKTDYEQIQLSQDAVVKTYQGTGKIDYAQISKSAMEINRSAIRLNSNLFPAVVTPDAEKEEKKQDKREDKPAKSVRDLIIELDNTIGSFATSPMFQNLRTVDAAVSTKAKQDLEKIMELSAALGTEAQKSASEGK